MILLGLFQDFFVKILFLDIILSISPPRIIKFYKKALFYRHDGQFQAIYVLLANGIEAKIKSLHASDIFFHSVFGKIQK